MPLLDPIPSLVADCSRSSLEWDRFLDLLAGYSLSPIGRAWVLALGPSTDLAWLERQHNLVAEMRLLLRQGVSVSLGSLFDPTQMLAKSAH